MHVYCECCVLSGRGLCDGLIARPEESYRVWCVITIMMPEQSDSPGPLWVLVSWGKKLTQAGKPPGYVVPSSS
jgi:hypothetical protein